MFPVFLNPDGKSILITGCDTGFGNALALKARSFGFYVFACCLDEDSDGAKKLKGNECDVLKMDVTDQVSIDHCLSLVKNALREQGLIFHGVVNNAGISIATGPAEWISLEDYIKTMDVNTFGVVRVTKTFLPLIRASKGRIVNVCSMASHVAVADMLPYCMSKGATFMFTNGLRRGLWKYGVKASSISPYFYATNIMSLDNEISNLQQAWKSALPEAREVYGGEAKFEKDELQHNLSRKVRTNLDEVINCMMDALTNENPKADYVVPSSFLMLLAIIESLPLKWADYVLGKMA